MKTAKGASPQSRPDGRRIHRERAGPARGPRKPQPLGVGLPDHARRTSGRAGHLHRDRCSNNHHVSGAISSRNKQPGRCPGPVIWPRHAQRAGLPARLDTAGWAGSARASCSSRPWQLISIIGFGFRSEIAAPDTGSGCGNAAGRYTEPLRGGPGRAGSLRALRASPGNPSGSGRPVPARQDAAVPPGFQRDRRPGELAAAVPPAQHAAHLAPRPGLRHQVLAEPRIALVAAHWRGRFRAEDQHPLRPRQLRGNRARPRNRHSVQRGVARPAARLSGPGPRPSVRPPSQRRAPGPG
jgi:hypothetical protein